MSQLANITLASSSAVAAAATFYTSYSSSKVEIRSKTNKPVQQKPEEAKEENKQADEELLNENAELKSEIDQVKGKPIHLKT